MAGAQTGRELKLRQVEGERALPTRWVSGLPLAAASDPQIGVTGSCGPGRAFPLSIRSVRSVRSDRSLACCACELKAQISPPQSLGRAARRETSASRQCSRGISSRRRASAVAQVPLCLRLWLCARAPVVLALFAGSLEANERTQSHKEITLAPVLGARPPDRPDRCRFEFAADQRAAPGRPPPNPKAARLNATRLPLPTANRSGRRSHKANSDHDAQLVFCPPVSRRPGSNATARQICVTYSKSLCNPTPSFGRQLAMLTVQFAFVFV